MRLWGAVKRLAVCVLVGLVAGCKASAGGKINSAGDAEGSASLEGEPEVDPALEPGAGAESSPALPELGQARGEAALLGARHDLFLRSEARVQSCTCLRIAAGHPRDPAFEWESVIPEIDPASQVVVAFSSRGEVCEGEPPESRGASYHGYEKRGADVVVMVEASRPGRPLVGGAVLPRPDAGGRILVVPVPGDMPYGKPKGDANAACEVATAAAGQARPVVDAAELPEPEPDAAAAFDEEGLLDDPNHPVDEDEELARRRTGFYLGSQLGAAYMRVSPYEDEFPAFSGFGFSFDLLIGGSPARDLAVGGMIGGATAPKPRYEEPDAPVGNGISMNAFRLGAFADYYFIPDENLHGMIFLGYEGLAFSRDEGLVDGSGGGIAGALGIGYDFWIGPRWSAGLLLRGSYAVLSFPGGKAGLLTPLLAGTVAFH